MSKIFLFFLFIHSLAAQQSLFLHSFDETFEELIQEIQTYSDHYVWKDLPLTRETIEFGLQFHDLENGLIVERPFPPSLIALREKIFAAFKDQLTDIAAPEEINNCIITFYGPGQGITPHADRSLKPCRDGRERIYYFSNSILGLILTPDTQQSLYFIDPKVGEQSRFFLPEQAGMAYLFQGTLRYDWHHGLFPVETGRISMNFRKVIFK